MPMQKQKKQQQQMLDELKPGDMVVTSGGIAGHVSRPLDADTIVLRVKPDNLKLQFARSAVASLVPTEGSSRLEFKTFPERHVFSCRRNLTVKTIVIVATILMCIFGIIGFPKSGARVEKQRRARISAWAWI